MIWADGVGSGIKDQDRNIRDNQILLLRVLRSVAPVLTVGPSSIPLSTVTKKKRKAETEDDELPPDSPSSPSYPLPDEMEDHYQPPSNTISTSKEFSPPSKAGTILITLLDQPPYTLWSLKGLAIHPPQLCPGTQMKQPKYRSVRSFKFDPSLYPGYAHRRTLGFKEGVSKKLNEEILGRKGEARTWEFELVNL